MGKARTEYLMVRVTPEAKAAFKARCAELLINESDAIRIALADWMRKGRK